MTDFKRRDHESPARRLDFNGEGPAEYRLPTHRPVVRPVPLPPLPETRHEQAMSVDVAREHLVVPEQLARSRETTEQERHARQVQEERDEVRAASRAALNAKAPEVPAPNDALSGLSGVQREGALTHEVDGLYALLVADARYLPAEARRQMVADALDQKARLGLDPEQLHGLLRERLPEDVRAELQFAVAKSQQAQRKRADAGREREQSQAVGDAAHAAQVIYATLHTPNVSGLIPEKERALRPELRLLSILGRFHERGQVGTLKAAYKARYGHDLTNGVLATVRDPVARRNVVELLGIFSEERLVMDGFLEQCAVRMAYMNDADLGSVEADLDLENADPDKRAQIETSLKPGALLSAFGYTTDRAYFGKWGFQMRVFYPKKGSKHREVVVAFRGTEGMQFNPFGENTSQSAIDTTIGDFAFIPTGYAQANLNMDLMALVLGQAAGRAPDGLTLVGHSLGGALAQLAAVRFKELVGRVVTFQAPAIEREDAQKLDEYNAQHKHAAVEATHYRVAGDVVPLAGEQMLSGDIFTFDRNETGAVAWNGQLGPLVAAGGAFLAWAKEAFAKTHVAFPLATHISGQEELSREEAALLEYGALDRQLTNAKGQPTGKEVSMALASVNTAASDPRFKGETGRQEVVAELWRATGKTAALFRENLTYNVLLTKLEKRLRAADSFDEDKEARWLEGFVNDQIEVDPESRKLGLDLGLMPAVVPRTVKVKLDTVLVLRRELRALWRTWHPEGRGGKP